MRLFSLLLASGICLAFHSADAGPVPNESNRAQEKISLQLKWFHQFQFAGCYAAKVLGYYSDEGLDVDIREIDPEKTLSTNCSEAR